MDSATLRQRILWQKLIRTNKEFKEVTFPALKKELENGLIDDSFM
ncbi:hypothetical protein AB434_2671 [Heyndrickxia coagulans]|nr:hypothetical protein AB434_2671 [Heyndrickxia coagulans]KYC61034.1 hypothetical protein B4100_0043 [Heyndrickxia coagulans]